MHLERIFDRDREYDQGGWLCIHSLQRLAARAICGDCRDRSTPEAELIHRSVCIPCHLETDPLFCCLGRLLPLVIVCHYHIFLSDLTIRKCPSKHAFPLCTRPYDQTCPACLILISNSMWLEMAAVFSRLSTDPQVRVVVLTAAGDKAFCAGLDVQVCLCLVWLLIA